MHADLFLCRTTISKAVVVTAARDRFILNMEYCWDTIIERGLDLSNGENKVSLEHWALYFLSTLIETELIEKTILNTYPTVIVTTATTTTTPTFPSSSLSVFLLNLLHFRTQPTTSKR